MTGYTVTIVARADLAMAPAAEAAYSRGTHRYVPGHILLAGLAAHWIRQFGPPGSDNPRQADFKKIFHGKVRYSPALADGSVIMPISARRAKRSDAVIDEAFREERAQLPDGDPGTPGKGQILGVRRIRVGRAELESDPGSGRERPRDGQLVAREAIRRGTTFKASIVGDHPWLDGLAAAGTPITVWLGGRKSTSGRAELSLTPDTARPGAGPVGEDVVVRLSSPAIFVDEATRPTLEPTSHDWERVFGVAGGTVLDRWARPGRMGGWHIASGLPRPEELIAVPGSTYRVAVPADADPEWPTHLRHLGLGLRTGEGFGFAEVCTSPWRPDAGRATDLSETTAAPAETLVNRHEAALTGPNRRWIADLLREILLARRTGQLTLDAAADPDTFVRDLGGGANTERLGPSQRDALAELARVENLAVLDDVITLLDDAALEVRQ